MTFERLKRDVMRAAYISEEERDRLTKAFELFSDAAMLPAGDSSGDAPKGLRRDEKGSGEAPEGGS